MSMKKPSESEEEFFARVEAEKQKKAALQLTRDLKKGERERLKALHSMCCPKCGMKLETVTFRGVAIGKCFHCNGTWLDEGDLEQLAGKEPGFLQTIISVFKG